MAGHHITTDKTAKLGQGMDIRAMEDDAIRVLWGCRERDGVRAIEACKKTT